MSASSCARPLGLAVVVAACAAGSSIEIPSYYKIVLPGNGPLGGPSYVTILPVKINNRGNVLFWQDTAPYVGTQLFRRNNGTPSFLVLPGRERDLDEDGAATVYDYNLLSANFDRQGDVY